MLKQGWFEEEIAVPKRRPYLPTVLSAEEITRMLDLTTNLKHWTIMALFYGTGCVLRSYMRQRERLVQAAGSCVQHMQQALTEMNIWLDNVISDITD